MFGISIWIENNKLISTEPYQLYRRYDGRWQTLDAAVVVPGMGMYRVRPCQETLRVKLDDIQVFDEADELIVFAADSLADCQAYLWGFQVGNLSMRLICHNHYNVSASVN